MTSAGPDRSHRDAQGPTAGPARAAYRVVGFLGGEFGLAVAARNTTRALSSSGRAVQTIAVETGRRRAQVPAMAGTAEAPGAPFVNLFHLNPIDVAETYRQWRPHVDLAAPAVCVPFWEMPLPPRRWTEILDAMDVVLAPTRFIAAACATVVGEHRVVHHPQAVFPPPGVRPDRERWALPSTSVVFVVSFDLGSDVERKNPWAALEAFRRAFPGGEDVRLVVKLRPWPGVARLEAAADALRRRAEADRRIRLVEASLPYEDVLGLYASADVMVSLHRSEGLGLHLMEAMSLGKVVVATGWSGNADFMDGGNSVRVPWRLVPVAPSHPAFSSEVGREGQVWAEPDVDEAARALRALHLDADRRRALGAAAQRDMEARRRTMLAGEAFDRLEAVVAGRAPRRSLGGAVRSTRARLLWADLLRAAQGVRRRLG